YLRQSGSALDQAYPLPRRWPTVHDQQCGRARVACRGRRTPQLDRGSDEGGKRAAAIYTLVASAKLNNVDPQAWLADVLARMPDYPAKRIGDLLPWNWRAERRAATA